VDHELDRFLENEARACFSRASALASPREPVYRKGSRGLGETAVFEQELERYFGGELDEATRGKIR
jgi:hypothetical protein